MQVLDSLPRGRLLSDLRQVGRLAQEFKSRQRLSGASGQLGYTVQNDGPWDISEAVTTAANTYVVATFELRYVADGTQTFPIALPYVDLTVSNGTDPAQPLSYLYGSGFNGALGWKDPSNSNNILLMNDFTRQIPYLSDPLEQRWTFGFSYQGSITYYLKVFVLASSDGTITVTRKS